MKALILAGGKGSRLSAAAAAPPKPLLRLGAKRLIDFSLQNAADARVEEIVVVTSPFTKDVARHCGSTYGGIPVVYATQTKPRGIVHAVRCAAGALGAADFMLMLADEVLLGADHAAMIDAFERERLFAALGVVAVTRASQVRKNYSVLEQGSDLRVRRLIEKPRRPHNRVMGTGHCVFRNRILSYIDACPVNPLRGEKELADLVQCAVDDGRAVKAYPLGGRYVNVNSPRDLEAAVRLLETKS
jgi:glucose-1-phosphate thymidylyltransferase